MTEDNNHDAAASEPQKVELDKVFPKAFKLDFHTSKSDAFSTQDSECCKLVEGLLDPYTMMKFKEAMLSFTQAERACVLMRLASAQDKEERVKQAVKFTMDYDLAGKKFPEGYSQVLAVASGPEEEPEEAGPPKLDRRNTWRDDIEGLGYLGEPDRKGMLEETLRSLLPGWKADKAMEIVKGLPDNRVEDMVKGIEAPRDSAAIRAMRSLCLTMFEQEHGLAVEVDKVCNTIISALSDIVCVLDRIHSKTSLLCLLMGLRDTLSARCAIFRQVYEDDTDVYKTYDSNAGKKLLSYMETIACKLKFGIASSDMRPCVCALFSYASFVMSLRLQDTCMLSSWDQACAADALGVDYSALSPCYELTAACGKN